MTVEQFMHAASRPEAPWEQVNWSQCEQKVRRLQERIVEATREGRHGRVKDLQWRGYQPLPLRRVSIPKSNGKLRPLRISTTKDHAMQALYLRASFPVAETTGDLNSYGFRPERSSADAFEDCFCVLNRKDAPWVLEGDIRGCLDNISHRWMLDHISTDKEILKK